jgi:hypothetical protein
VNPLRMRSGPRRSWPAADMKDSISLWLAAISCSYSLRSSMVASSGPALPGRSGTSCTRAMKLLPSGRRTARRRCEVSEATSKPWSSSGIKDASETPRSCALPQRNSVKAAGFAAVTTPSHP